MDLSFLPCLKSFIANSNHISGVRGIGLCPDLSTLVISRNNLTQLDFLRRGGHFLQKLSLSHNQISEILESDLGLHLVKLRELRLNNNKIKKLPASVSKLTSLSLLDLGRNNISSLEDILPLKNVACIRNLNLIGNPITRSRGYPHNILELLDGRLEVLDNKRITTPRNPAGFQHKDLPPDKKRSSKSKIFTHQPRSSEDGDTTNEESIDRALHETLAPYGKLAAYNPFDEYAAGNHNPDTSQLDAAIKDFELSESRRMLREGEILENIKPRRGKQNDTNTEDSDSFYEQMKHENTGIREINEFPGNGRKRRRIQATIANASEITFGERETQ